MQVVDGRTFTLDKFVFKARELLSYAGLKPDVSEEVAHVLDQMYACFSLFKKFDSVFNEIIIKPHAIKDQDLSDFNTNLKVVGWLSFILAKRNMPEYKEAFELVFLMAAVISFILTSVDEQITLYLRNSGEKQQSGAAVMEYMKNFLKIKDGTLLARVQEAVRNYFKKRLQPEIGPFDLRSLDRVYYLQKQLDLLYQRQVSHDELDERLFLANRKKNLSPKVQSPVKRKVKTMEKKLDYETDLMKTTNFASRRVLDYEKTVSFSKHSNFNDLVPLG